MVSAAQAGKIVFQVYIWCAALEFCRHTGNAPIATDCAIALSSMRKAGGTITVRFLATSSSSAYLREHQDSGVRTNTYPSSLAMLVGFSWLGSGFGSASRSGSG